MELTVLGCSGGIGGGRKTTAFRIDDDILLDAGGGIADLSLDEMAAIRHIFLTHSHLDHTHGIPLMVDSIFDRIKEPLLIHALPETIKVLQEHFFNWHIWPDFSRLPHPDSPVLRFVPMAPGDKVEIDGRSITSIAVNHNVPAVGYYIQDKGGAAVAFSGDTTSNDSFWQALNGFSRLDMLVVECAFTDDELELARISRHYCPQLLGADLGKLSHQPPIYLTHAKPGGEQQIIDQCCAHAGGRAISRLSAGDVFTL